MTSPESTPAQATGARVCKLCGQPLLPKGQKREHEDDYRHARGCPYGREGHMSIWFNDDQVSWMKYLDSLPAEAKCACGWNLKGECPKCDDDRETIQDGDYHYYRPPGAEE
jgi:hypothetical protein